MIPTFFTFGSASDLGSPTVRIEGASGQAVADAGTGNC